MTEIQKKISALAFAAILMFLPVMVMADAPTLSASVSIVVIGGKLTFAANNLPANSTGQLLASNSNGATSNATFSTDGSGKIVEGLLSYIAVEGEEGQWSAHISIGGEQSNTVSWSVIAAKMPFITVSASSINVGGKVTFNIIDLPPNQPGQFTITNTTTGKGSSTTSFSTDSSGKVTGGGFGYSAEAGEEGEWQAYVAIGGQTSNKAFWTVKPETNLPNGSYCGQDDTVCASDYCGPDGNCANNPDTGSNTGNQNPSGDSTNIQSPGGNAGGTQNQPGGGTQVQTTKSFSSQDRCKAFAAQFGGLFDWALKDPAYCTLGGLLLKIINYGLAFAGVVVVIMLIVGGYRYIASAGNEEQVEKGRKTLTGAVIGLIIILLAFMMVRITANFITGDNGAPGSQNAPGNASGVSAPAGASSDPATIEAGIGAIAVGASVQGSNVIATASIAPADAPKLNAMCGSSDPSGVVVNVSTGTDNLYLGDANFKQDSVSGNWAASVSVSKDKFPQGSNIINFTVCGTRLPPPQAVDIQP